MKHKTLKDKLDACEIKYVGKYPHRYKVLYREGNNELFSWLEEQSFFKFHASNVSKRIVYYHQVVAFFFCGGKEALANGFTCIKGSQELHHIDGHTMNNWISNLVYLTSEIHAAITKHQKALHKYLRVFKKGQLDSTVIWNKKGKLVTRVLDWLGQILIKTMLKTASSRGINISLKLMGIWIARIVKRLSMGVDSSFVPTIIINYE